MEWFSEEAVDLMLLSILANSPPDPHHDVSWRLRFKAMEAWRDSPITGLSRGTTLASVTNIWVGSSIRCMSILSLKSLDDSLLPPPVTRLTVVDIREIADALTRKEAEKE